MISMTGLTLEQHKKIGALSKGYRQRVGLAQALIHEPEVLILDEPTSGLDPNQLAEIRNLIKEIGKEKTIMLSTHIMQEVEAVCDRAIIIHNGRIVADDSTGNLQHMTQSRSMIRVEFSSPVEKKLIKSIAGIKEAYPVSGTRHMLPEESASDKSSYSIIWLLESESGRDVRADVFKFAVDKALTVLSLQKEEQKLEEVFQELTKN
jgi:ABC-2 type transport system ATP-binding protein